MITTMAMTTGVSVDVGIVQGSEANGQISLHLTVCSLSARLASVALRYRRDDFDEWHDDMRIVACDAKVVNSNEMLGLPCSAEGYQSVVVWDHAANGLAAGSRCSLMAVVIPTPNVMTRSEEWSHAETLLGDMSVHGAKSTSRLLGFDLYGDMIVLDSHYVRVLDADTGEEIYSTPRLNDPRHATGSRAGGVIVAEANGAVTEFNEDGFVATLDMSAFANGEVRVACDWLTGNVLVSGASIAQVTEVSWGGTDHGTVLWTHGTGTPGSGDDDLNLPAGVSYGDTVSVVAICDAGNNRVVVVDRTSATPTTIHETVEVDGQAVPLVSPEACAFVGGNLYVCEYEGAKNSFATTTATHPALARSGWAASGVDALPQYAGMRFVPIARPIA